MVSSFRKPSHADDYFELYKARYMREENGETVLLTEVIEEDIKQWMAIWLGFNWFLREWAMGGLFNLDYFQAVQDVVNQEPRDRRMQVLAERFSVFLGWDAVKVMCLMDYLENRRKQDGLGATLESVARTEGGYHGVMNKLSQNDGERFYRFNDNHPGLLDHAMDYFYMYFSKVLDDDIQHENCLLQLERGDAEGKFQGLIDLWLSPISEEVVGGMFETIGFYNFIKRIV